MTEDNSSLSEISDKMVRSLVSLGIIVFAELIFSFGVGYWVLLYNGPVGIAVGFVIFGILIGITALVFSEG